MTTALLNSQGPGGVKCTAVQQRLKDETVLTLIPRLHGPLDHDYIVFETKGAQATSNTGHVCDMKQLSSLPWTLERIGHSRRTGQTAAAEANLRLHIAVAKQGCARFSLGLITSPQIHKLQR